MNNLDSKVSKLLGTRINESLEIHISSQEEFLSIIRIEILKVYDYLSKLGLVDYTNRSFTYFEIYNTEDTGIILDALEDLYGSPEIHFEYPNFRYYTLAPVIVKIFYDIDIRYYLTSQVYSRRIYIEYNTYHYDS